MDPLLEDAPCGFVSFGDDGVITIANRTLQGVLGVDSLVGLHIESLMTLPSRIFFQTHLLPLIKMKGSAEEIYSAFKTSSGEEIPLLLNGRRTERDGKPANDCVVVPMRRRSEYEDEILAAKRAKEEAYEVLAGLKQLLEQKQQELIDRNCELETLRESLEERVEERTAALQAANSELQQLTYTIAHNLRAPMRAIMSTSRHLQEDLPQLEAEQAAMLERQALNAIVLSSLVDDHLAFVRLGQRPMQPVSLDLTELADRTMRDILAQGNPAGVLFQARSGLELVADPSMMRLALEHLLGNAVKFSPGGGTVTLGWSGERDAFFVQDEGIGLEPQFSSKIFLPFERLHLEGEFAGNGIGLSLVQRVVERHRGTVWVESEPGRGTTVYFRM